MRVDVVIFGVVFALVPISLLKNTHYNFPSIPEGALNNKNLKKKILEHGSGLLFIGLAL